MITGLHHVTAIAGNAQENLDFYAGILGMRLVKKSVNQDDPGTYHLFYADAEGHPGTDLTFFPWANMPAGRLGTGLAIEVPLAVPAESLGYWAERLKGYGVAVGDPTERFGDTVLPFTDTHGMALALVGITTPRPFAPWSGSPVPEAHQIRGLEGGRTVVRHLAPAATFLTETLGFAEVGTENGWTRFAVAGGGSGKVIDILEQPNGRAGQWGVGTVHHIAWSLPDDAQELALRAKVQAAGHHPTDVIDRFWFKSVYFREPGGVLFELATAGPGFSVDEHPDTLGESLILPPWLESLRPKIEAALPTLMAPNGVEATDRS
jgi:glyoxalase family protein